MAVVINGYCHFARNITHSKRCVLCYFLLLFHMWVCVCWCFFGLWLCFNFCLWCCSERDFLSLCVSFIHRWCICHRQQHHHDQLSRCYFLYTHSRTMFNNPHMTNINRRRNPLHIRIFLFHWTFYCSFFSSNCSSLSCHTNDDQTNFHTHTNCVFVSWGQSKNDF